MRVLPSWIWLAATRRMASERGMRMSSMSSSASGCGGAGGDVFGEVDLHPLAEEAGAGVVAGEEGPLAGAEAGLFDHLALGGGEGSLAGLDASGGEFEEVLAGGVAVLADEDDVGVAWLEFAGGIDGEDDDGAVVVDDVAGDDGAVGLFHFVGGDVEDFALVGDLGGEELGAADVGALGGFGESRRRLWWGGVWRI